MTGNAGLRTERSTLPNALPRALQAATGSTYCKAIVANRKLPDRAEWAHGAETRAPCCVPGRLEADDPVALVVQLAAGNLQSNLEIRLQIAARG